MDGGILMSSLFQEETLKSCRQHVQCSSVCFGAVSPRGNVLCVKRRSLFSIQPFASSFSMLSAKEPVHFSWSLCKLQLNAVTYKCFPAAPDSGSPGKKWKLVMTLSFCARHLFAKRFNLWATEVRWCVIRFTLMVSFGDLALWRACCWKQNSVMSANVSDHQKLMNRR